MKVHEIARSGKLAYSHHYMQTMTGCESAAHSMEAPKTLVTLAARYPSAEVVRYGDGSLGIEIDGRLWAAQVPDRELRPATRLPHEVWQYCILAMGRDGDA